MKKKLVLIALLAASFGWGFSELVEVSNRTVRASASLGCQDWPNCSQPAPRRQP